MPLKNRMARRALAARQAGLSLVEVLIALVIGLVVIGAVMVNYLGTGFTGRSSSALAQVTEDASVALNVIRSHVALAGYGQPVQFNAGTGRLELTLGAAGRKIFGCDNGFQTADVGTLDELTCANGAGNDAIAVLYEADASNSATVTVGGVNRQADCIGTGIAPTPAAGTVPQHFRAEARFYINRNRTLLCQGNGGNALAVAGTNLATAPQPLAENIQTLQIRYGLSADVAPPGLPARPGERVTRYVNASDITQPAQWNNVRAVRVCVVARSENEVLDRVTPYFGCFAAGANDLIVPADRRIYRAFTTTVMLQNRF